MRPDRPTDATPPRRPVLPAWARMWLMCWSSISGLLALVWLILRTGTKPSRLTYPCQQAALSAAWLAFSVPIGAAGASLLRGLSAPLRRPLWTLTGVLGLLATLGLWGYASRTPEYRGPVTESNLAYRAQLFQVTGCPQSPVGDRFPGVDCLVNRMGQNGLPFHRSNTVSTTSGPSGLIGSNDVVLLKINYQWSERGGTNVDVLQGVMRWIADHPDGFTGEIVVCENAQFNSTDNFDRPDNNAEDITFSPHDAVVHFQNLGVNASHFDWTSVRYDQVSEYSAGNMNDGYVVHSYDPTLDGHVSYPKFRTDAGTYVSIRYGIWNPGSGTYDRDRLKLINLPVLKSHSATYGATAAVKNYMGVVTDELGTNSHNSIRRGILGALMGEARPADLSILDAIWINANPWDGPFTGYADATRRDELVASTDPVALDIWAVKNILIPAFLANGYSPPWPSPSADPDDPSSDFRQYLDASMQYIRAAGFDATNDLTQIDVYSGGCGSTGPVTMVTGPGPGATNPPQVKTWDTQSPPVNASTWTAYGTNQAGVNVGGADFVAGGDWEVLTGPGPGAAFGPQVRGFDATGTPFAKINYYAYGTLKFGAHAAGGDLDADSHHEILTSPGPGAVFGPHIRAWNFDGSALSAISKVNFFAYGTLKYGARNSAGRIDGDAFAEIATGAGAGAVFGAHVRGFDYDNGTLSAMPLNLFAFSGGRYGAAVAAGDVYGNGRAEVVVAHGPDATMSSEVRGYAWSGGASLAFSFIPFGYSGGAEIAAADIEGDGVAEVFAGAGWGAANPTEVAAFEISGSAGTQMPGLSFTSYGGLSYGTKVAVIESP